MEISKDRRRDEILYNKRIIILSAHKYQDHIIIAKDSSKDKSENYKIFALKEPYKEIEDRNLTQ